MSFKVERGNHLLIVGPNGARARARQHLVSALTLGLFSPGCGKSSMFRILGGLCACPSPLILFAPSLR